MVGKVKSKKHKDASEPLPVVLRGNFELTIGTKVEAKDYLGNWYAAKVTKVRKECEEVLVHFDGWNSRFDVWLPCKSDKLRSPKTTNKNKSKEKEWRVGDRVIAKWGPAGKLYPATISKILNEMAVEVTFYDGFRKSINKSSLKLDKEKLYRQYEDIFRKDIISPPKLSASTETPKSVVVTNVSGRLKRRLTEPAAMADYVTDLHKKRRTKSAASEEDLQGGKSASTISATISSNFQSDHQSAIPTVKPTVSSGNVSLNHDEKTELSMPHKIKRSDVEIVKKKSKSYILFPLSSPKDIEDGPQHSKHVKRGAPVEIAPQNKEFLNTESAKENSQEGPLLPHSTSSNISLKIRFPFSTKGKSLKGNKPKLENRDETSATMDAIKTEKFSPDHNQRQDSNPVHQQMLPLKSDEIFDNASHSGKMNITAERLEKRKIKLSQKVREAQTAKQKSAMRGKLRGKKPPVPVKVFSGKESVRKNLPEKLSSKPSSTFEDKYEMFKRKWKVEKERRRKMLESMKVSNNDKKVDSSTSKSVNTLVSREKSSKEDKLDKKGIVAVNKSSINVKAENCKPKLKMTERSKQITQTRTNVVKKDTLVLKNESAEVFSKSKKSKEVIESKVKPVEKVNVTALSEPLATNIVSNITDCDVPKAKTRGWPKGRPRKKKSFDVDYFPDGCYLLDTSRTPNVGDTLSVASMVAEERPSQRKRPESSFEMPPTKVWLPKQTNTGSMMKANSSRYLIQPPYRPFSSSPIRQPYLSAAKLAAAKIQKRVHQQKWMSTINTSEQLSAIKPPDILISVPAVPLQTNQQQLFEQTQNTLVKSKDQLSSMESDFDEEPIIIVQPSADDVSSMQKDNDNEIDLTNIKLRENKKSEDIELKPILKKRKSLDFITGRLQYKQRMASIKQQSLSEQKNFDVKIPLYPQSQMSHVFSQSNMIQHQNQHQQHLTSPMVTHSASATNIYIPGGLRPPIFSTSVYLRNPNVSQNLRMMSVNQQLIPNPNMHSPNLYVSPMPPYRPRPVQQQLPIFAQNIMQQFPNVQCLPSEVADPRLHFPPLTDRSVMVCRSNNGNPMNFFPQNLHPIHQQHRLPNARPPPVMCNLSSPPLTPIIPISSQYADKASKHQILQDSITLAAANKGKADMVIFKQEENNKECKTSQEEKEKKEVEGPTIKGESKQNVERNNDKVKNETDEEKRLKEKKISKEHLSKKKTKSDVDTKESSIDGQLEVYACKVPGCSKTFRKSHLLEYHQKYFHTIKPVPKRSRSSISVSSTDSTSVSLLTSPNDPVGKKSEEVDESSVVNEDAESSDSEYEEDSPVDDRVKCICEDDCELGFMIQCEQCFTWQHGECVGYSQQNDVPLYYLCHICSNPKGLRKSQAYKNDYIWFRHGRLHPVFQDGIKETKKDTDACAQHVDIENEEVLSHLMLTVHGMAADLSKLKDCMHHIRTNFIIFKDVNHQKLQQWEADERDVTDLLNSMNCHHLAEESSNKCNAQKSMDSSRENKDSTPDDIKPTDNDGAPYSGSIQSVSENHADGKDQDEKHSQPKQNIQLDNEDLKPVPDNTLATVPHPENEFEELTGIFKETTLENARTENLLARYKLLVEVEKVEDEINERLEKMVERVTELEKEYDHIDQSEALVADLKTKFQLPDLRDILSFLNEVKWASILKSKDGRKTENRHTVG